MPHDSVLYKSIIDRRKWRLTDIDLCLCGETQTMSYIVKSCLLTKLNGGLSRLHSADENAVLWLTNYVHDTHRRRIKRNDIDIADDAKVEQEAGQLPFILLTYFIADLCCILLFFCIAGVVDSTLYVVCTGHSAALLVLLLSARMFITALSAALTHMTTSNLKLQSMLPHSSLQSQSLWKFVCLLIIIITRGQSNLTKSASRGAHSPVRGHPRGSKFVPLNSWGRVSY